MKTVKRVFYAIAHDNLHTRREIADSLDLSVVSVGKAVDSLIRSRLISADSKNSSSSGRRSDFIDVDPSSKALLIDLSQRDFYYSLSTLSDPTSDGRSFAHVDSLDFEGNLSLLIADIKKRVGISPMRVALMLPGDVNGGKMGNSLVSDYSGFDIVKMLSDNGFTPDVCISCAEAVELSGEFRLGDVFVSAGDTAWGTFGRGQIENLDCVPVDASGKLTYAEALRCSPTDESILKYTKRFFLAISGVLSPKRILLSCDLISKQAKRELEAEMPTVKCISAREMALDGLMSCVCEQILDGIS